jgi:hypothetical protein
MIRYFKRGMASWLLAATLYGVFCMEQPTTSLLPLDIQTKLIGHGRDLIKVLRESEKFDIGQSELDLQIFPLLSPWMSQAVYSNLSGWDPTKYVRWFYASTDPIYILNRKNYMCGIIAISWALDDMAKKQGDDFERGSFTIIDPNHTIANFLTDYVRLVNGGVEPKTLAYSSTTSNFAYPRDPEKGGSSHHKGRCPESQFGIDVRFDSDAGLLKLLPHNDTHFLFAQLNLGGQSEPLLFVKFEPVGMGSIGAVAVHGGEYLRSTMINTGKVRRREKDILKPIAESFTQLCYAMKIGDDIEYKTIRSLYFLAENLTYSPDTLVSEKAKAFILLVNQLYPNGNNHLRVGNEVILDLRKL